ncbi:hypothetical protein [Micromonospora sp. NBC_01813]|uniref:hypothetical protein n=1 Tax=Micromonospora sp. NBC_01813 TaxID=2975988 RepID=UPI002DDAD1DF|nr:hypothetical protein [Micromonospora sp. NBC_01813]WSA07652.1 hypothetical protein OG958_25960 [Micromonospora sp. NBC_01813]
MALVCGLVRAQLGVAAFPFLLAVGLAYVYLAERNRTGLRRAGPAAGALWALAPPALL